MKSARARYIVGNWKMHLAAGEAAGLARAIAAQVSEADPQVVLAPAYPFLPIVAQAVDGGPVAVGGQDAAPEPAGAFTGDVSAAMLASVGATYCIVGHSERRRYHGEGGELLARKLRAVRDAGLTPIYCIGETEAEREAGETGSVLRQQLTEAALSPVGPLIIAYEPVWAIGTGKAATADIAQETHAAIRRILEALTGKEAAANTPVLYGGSVKADNAASLFAQPDIDGALAGGASLDATAFLAIVEACAAVRI